MMMNIVTLVKSKMKWKLMIVISALMLFIVLFTGLIVYQTSSSIIKDDVERLSKQVLKQANLNLERFFKNYSDNFLLMSFSPEIENWLSVKKDDRLNSFVYFQRIRDNYIVPFMYQNPEVISVSLYNDNGNEINYSLKYGYRLDYSFEKSELGSLLEHNNIAYVRWSNDYYFEGKSISLPVITLFRKISYGNHTGYMKSDINLQSALQLINELEMGSNGYGYIVNSEGRIIAHPNEELIANYVDYPYIETIKMMESGSIFNKESNEIILFGSINYYDWKTVIVVPYHEFASSVYFVRKFTVLVALAGLVLSIFCAILVSSSFTKRIAKLRKMIKETSRGKNQIRTNIGGTDEVAELGNVYNGMLDDLSNTVNELAESKISGQKAVLSALQSQIDSHFLYNTLELINSLASLEGHTQIEQTTIALAKMLRYTSDYKSSVVPLAQEIEHLRNYLDIMKLRMGEQLQYELDVDYEALESVCLKAILQPIVENSMKHAQPHLDEPLHIFISIGCKEIDGQGYIELKIRDNGRGFSQQKLNWLNRQINHISLSPLYHTSTNIGLLNIHFRLQMFYQNIPHSGILIRNLDRNVGAEVLIRVPKFQSIQEVNTHAV